VGCGRREFDPRVVLVRARGVDDRVLVAMTSR